MTICEKLTPYILNRYTKAGDDFKFITKREYFFEKHCGQRMLKIVVYFEDRWCKTHKNYKYLYTFHVCQCPDCHYFYEESDYGY